MGLSINCTGITNEKDSSFTSGFKRNYENSYVDLKLFDFYKSELSEEYWQNQSEIADMKKQFYLEHPLPEDNPYGTIGLTQTKRYKQRDAEWAKIEAQYMADHPISEEDKAVLEKEMKRKWTFAALC